MISGSQSSNYGLLFFCPIIDRRAERNDNQDYNCDPEILPMNSSSEKLTKIKNNFVTETKKLVVITAYIMLVMLGLRIYKIMILEEYQISYFHVGFSFFEAMILSKVIMLGEFLKLGERFNDRPLIVKTVYKSFCMSLLALLFSIVEYSIEGLIASRSLFGVLIEIALKGKGEMLAQTLLIFINFIPLFAIWETGKAMGNDQLFQLLFTRPDKA